MLRFRVGPDGQTGARMGTSALRAQLHLFGYHAGIPSPLSRGNGSRFGIAWSVIRALAATSSAAGAQPRRPKRNRRLGSIDPSIYGPVLGDLPYVMIAEPAQISIRRSTGFQQYRAGSLQVVPDLCVRTQFRCTPTRRFILPRRGNLVGHNSCAVGRQTIRSPHGALRRNGYTPVDRCS